MAETKPQAAPPPATAKKPGLWARVANARWLQAVGEAIGNAKFGQ